MARERHPVQPRVRGIVTAAALSGRDVSEIAQLWSRLRGTPGGTRPCSIDFSVTAAAIAELAVKAGKEPEEEKDDDGPPFRSPVRSIEKRKVPYVFSRSPTTFPKTHENLGLTLRFEDWGWKLTRAPFREYGGPWTGSWEEQGEVSRSRCGAMPI